MVCTFQSVGGLSSCHGCAGCWCGAWHASAPLRPGVVQPTNLLCRLPRPTPSCRPPSQPHWQWPPHAAAAGAAWAPARWACQPWTWRAGGSTCRPSKQPAARAGGNTCRPFSRPAPRRSSRQAAWSRPAAAAPWGTAYRTWSFPSAGGPAYACLRTQSLHVCL